MISGLFWLIVLLAIIGYWGPAIWVILIVILGRAILGTLCASRPRGKGGD